MSTPAPTDQAGVRSILLAYDFSDASHKPLRHALTIARHFGAKLYVGYIVSSIGYEIAGPETSQLAAAGSERDAQQLEANLLKSGALAGLEYEFIIREGNVWEQLELILQQKQIDAIVVGTHGREGLGRLMLGSVAEQVFRQANCLVLIVGPGSREDSLIERNEPARPFLFATDFSAASLRALPYAASFANHFGAKLVVLHVLPAAPNPDSARKETQERFDELIARTVPPATKVELLVKFGAPAEQIVEACRALNANLVILGLHSAPHAATASHLPWIRAHEIVCGASCPVLTLKDSRPAT